MRQGKPRGKDGKICLVGYVRVSTEEQARGGVSLDAQRERLQAYCQTYPNCELVDIVADEGASGRLPIAKREGLRRCMALINGRKVDGLLVLKIDRLSRDANLILNLSREALEKGWHLVSVQDRLDTSSAAGRFFLGILALLAEMESGQTGERVTMGMDHLFNEQRRCISHKTPFGWRMPDGTWMPKKRDTDSDDNKTGEKDKRTMVPWPEEIAIVTRMQALDAEGKSAYVIARTLNNDGVTNPRSGGKWHCASIASILATAQKRAVG